MSRSELQSPQSTPEPAPDPEAIERLKRQSKLNYETHEPLNNGEVDEQAEDEDLDFRLFATSNPETSTTATKIRLKSPTPQTTEPGFANGGRPLHYYFADPTKKKVSQYTASALSGADILALSKHPWPGSAYPWKVLHLPASADLKSTMSSTCHTALFTKLLPPENIGGRKRRRLGKKSRIRIRTQAAASRAKVELAKAETEAREAAAREKRTRENRAKKARKRMKERGKKGDGVAAGDGETVGVGD